MPLRTFSVSTQCNFRDETGNFGKATVDIANSKVNALKVELTMPKRGSCRYDLASSARPRPCRPSSSRRPRLPHHHGSRASRSPWPSPTATPVFPSSAHDYVWPLLIDKATGQCD
jgi:hypothetical protein